ncbi:hypothetical protein GIB67_037090 [Kingdonia uniflora]|uniref:DUF6821 domain-containing protein n=1 Tax=Kingdonia uniflora TaxID=39325 RepID=A0A7J7LHV7_9MAGN|nr:hypothetical protein GIB67_037090 [Kingdonia uniflora]
MEEIGDFHDWELLQNPDSVFLDSSQETQSLIRSDYFSLDSDIRHAKSVVITEEEISVDSDDSSLIKYDFNLINRVGFHGISVFEGNQEMGIGDDEEREVGFEGIREIRGVEVENEGFGVVRFKGDGGIEGVGGGIEGFEESGSLFNLKTDVGFVGIGEIEGAEAEIENHGESDSLNELGFEGNRDSIEVTEVKSVEGGELDSSECSKVVAADGAEFGTVVEQEGDVVGVDGGVSAREEAKTGIIWWKLPLELMKFCVFRVSPLWSFSIAAAVMGLVILRKRLYKMKRKSRSIPLKITIEDKKKVSQFMARAAHLNEAFSVVKSVPLIRPPMPAVGVTPWPVMGLR